ncbi:MFS transporter [Mangrovibacterium lignilyticum]|uniref:MFS transporter n=1 Tax=Mangrovibacterium lignilyticum TaxID=2668052 RepID=UPI0013D1D7E8|nr:MFS transporter [Mangrovibacterium lignilyticum]
MLKQKFNNFPFSPTTSPFFYGWVILAVGTMGVLMSAPGQTSGVSTFTDHLIDVFGITRDQLSTTYLIGTICSSLLLTHAGKLYDKIGARWMGVLTAITLGIVLFYMSQSDRIAFSLGKLFNLQAAQFYLSVAVLSVGFFLLRLSGQGAMTMLSRNMIMKWFVVKRGLAGGISSVFVAFGFSVAPYTFDQIIQHFGWRVAWMIMGVTAILVFSLIVFIFYRDNPEDCKLVPDGDADEINPTGPVLNKAQKQYRLKEARKTYVFWLYSISLAVFALMMTGIIFNVISIFDQANMARDEALFIFIPASLISTIITLAGGYLSDFVKLKVLLIIYLCTLSCTAISIPYLEHSFFYYLLIVGNGASTGIYSVLISVAWPRFFGRKYLGEISGFAMSLLVFFSAIGPLIFSLSLSQFGSYSVAAWICLSICIICLIGAFSANNPQENINMNHEK